MHSTHHIPTILIIIALLIPLLQAVPILNNQEIKFQMNGLLNYVPDAGGAQQSGYNLTIGFSSFSWLGVLFVTSSIKQDFLAVEINDFYSDNGGTFKGHLVSYKDYFLSDSVLKEDTITTFDISSFTYSNTKSYSLNIVRNLQSNSA